MPDDSIEYKTLDENSKEALRRKCISYIRVIDRTTWIDVCFNSLETFFRCGYPCSSACDWITGDDLREKNIEIVLKVLLNKSKTKKMFYHEIDEEQSKKIAKGIYNEIQIDYDKMDVYLLAAALKVYCILYLDYYLPKDIHFSLLKVFKANKRTTQKEIIKRLPFIMDNQIRMFFIGLFDLFRGISENTNESETTLDNLLDLFGPLVIKNPENYIDFNAFTKREVLKDLMKADFEHVSIDFLQD